MLKRTLLACALAAGAAYADTDTKPMLAAIHECTQPGLAEHQDVRVAFTVSETGAISDMHVVQSSGSTAADERVMKCVAGYSFKPATHNGVAVASPFHFDFHWGELQEMEGDRHAFALFEHDVDRRCHKLYPIDRRFYIAANPISGVTLTRLESGEVQTSITQSAGEKADKNAIRCVLDILKDHDDLPAVFSRTFMVDWLHHTVEGRR